MDKSYEKLDIKTFGEQLLTTLDLDPIYVMLYRAKLDEELLKRWLMAYWCFYSTTTASAIAESKNWHKTARQAQNEKWARGRERRHFRGQASSNTLYWLQAAYPEIEKAVDFLAYENSFVAFSHRINQWPLFGPWIAFKAADMLERLMGAPVKFSVKDLQFYKEPVEGAKLWQPNKTLRQCVEELITHFRAKGMKAPPGLDRPFDIAEAETCLCKYKSHVKGYYPVGIDTEEIKQSLVESKGLAKRLSECVP